MHASSPRFLRTVIAVTMAGAAVSAVASESCGTCAGIQDDASRLACYDNLSGRPPVPEAPLTPPPAAAAAPAVAATSATAAVATSRPASPAIVTAAAQPVEKQVEQFGLDPAAAQKQASKAVAPSPPDRIESIDSTVTGTKRRGTGELVLTLANDQIWMQTQADSKVWIRPGDPVTIKKALLGSYMLVSGRYAFKVRRLD